MLAGFAGWCGTLISMIVWNLFIKPTSQGKDISETAGFIEKVIQFDEAVPWWGGVGMIFGGCILMLGSIFR